MFKKIAAIILIITLCCTSIIPDQSSASKQEASTLTPISQEDIAEPFTADDLTAGDAAQPQVSVGADVYNSTDLLPSVRKQLLKKASNEQDWANPKQTLNAIRTDFSPAMKQIAAYFYPALFKLLDEAQRKEVVQWSTKQVNATITALKPKERKLLEQYAPLAIESLDFYTDRKVYMDKHPIAYTKAECSQITY